MRGERGDVSARARFTAGLLAATLCAAPAAGAASWRELDGSYAITAADMLAPDPDAPHDTHLRLQLRGLPARDLYRAMRVQPGVDECTGGWLKAVDNVRCVFFEDSRRYQCDFAVDLRDGRLDVGIPC